MPLFAGAGEERLTRFPAKHVLRRALKKAPISASALTHKAVSQHLLRHTLAMQFLQSGVDLITTQAWLGHAQVATTHRYAEAKIEMMRDNLAARMSSVSRWHASSQQTRLCSCSKIVKTYVAWRCLATAAQRSLARIRASLRHIALPVPPRIHLLQPEPGSRQARDPLLSNQRLLALVSAPGAAALLVASACH